MPRSCECGCGDPVVRSTAKWIRGHHAKPAGLDYRITETGCWEWQRSIATTGYGRIKVNGRWKLAHRVYYERFVGPAPALPLQLDHVCRNRRCVNPAHLVVTDYSGNARNRHSSGEIDWTRVVSSGDRRGTTAEERP